MKKRDRVSFPPFSFCRCVSLFLFFPNCNPEERKKGFAEGSCSLFFPLFLFFSSFSFNRFRFFSLSSSRYRQDFASLFNSLSLFSSNFSSFFFSPYFLGQKRRRRGSLTEVAGSPPFSLISFSFALSLVSAPRRHLGSRLRKSDFFSSFFLGSFFSVGGSERIQGDRGSFFPPFFFHPFFPIFNLFFGSPTCESFRAIFFSLFQFFCPPYFLFHERQRNKWRDIFSLFPFFSSLPFFSSPCWPWIEGANVGPSLPLSELFSPSAFGEVGCKEDKRDAYRSPPPFFPPSPLTPFFSLFFTRIGSRRELAEPLLPFFPCLTFFLLCHWQISMENGRRDEGYGPLGAPPLFFFFSFFFFFSPPRKFFFSGRSRSEGERD